MKGHIHSIQTFGTVDGPGTRFVVFFQGCPMRCAYCHNPDTWETNTGELMDVSEILAQYDNLKEFYDGGGITCSGGEPLMQMDFLIELFEAAKKKNIHTCLDTSGIIFTPDDTQMLDKFNRLIKSTDLILLDIKHIDPLEHKKLTGHSNENILMFAKYLSDNHIPMWIRHVVVPKITYDSNYLKKLGAFISTLPSAKSLEVLPYHTLGVAKYESLGLDYLLKDTPALNSEELKHAKHIILEEISKNYKS